VTVDVVATPAEAASLAMPPLLVLEAVERFLDERGLGAGRVRAERIGTGHSNATFAIERDGLRVVLRRPPRPPLPPSAHDMLREARVIGALGGAGARVPRIVAVCDDEAYLGVPFYLMEEIAGVAVTAVLPPALEPQAERRRLSEDLVDALAEIHAVDWQAAGLEGFGRPSGYLERQVRRFAGLWPINKTREVPDVERCAELLEARLPQSPPATVVHGDYRLGNVLVGEAAPARIRAVVDWELATLGDPLADLGYLCVTWSQRGRAATAIELARMTGEEGFLTRDELVARYEQRTGRSAGDQRFYQALALWKSAVFCEAIYGRYLRGETRQPFAAALGEGVPSLARSALALLAP
jgi:aminoglycoside phosphotransferase (APT) family kinase protein